MGVWMLWREKEHARRDFQQAQQAYEKETALRQEAEEDRQAARQAVDDWYTDVAERWLKQEGGLQPIQREFLQKALKFYQKLAQKESTDPAIRDQTAGAYFRVGAIELELGNPGPADEAFERACALLQALVTEFPERADYRHQLAKALDNRAVLWEKLGRTSSQRQLYARALELREQVVKDAPDIMEFRVDLARSLRVRGNGYRGAQNWPKAEEFYTRALGQLQEVARREPARHDVQLAMAELYKDLAAVKWGTGDQREGIEGHRKVLEVLDKLATARPEVRTSRRFRGLFFDTYHGLALFLGEMGQFSEAVDACKNAVAVRQALVDQYPQTVFYREGLAHECYNLGLLFHRARQPREAQNAFQQAREQYTVLAKVSPDCCHDLACTLNELGVLAHNRGDFVQARQLLEESIREEKTALERQQPKERGFGPLASHSQNLVRTMLRQGDHAAAARTAAETAAFVPYGTSGYIKSAGFFIKCLALAEKDAKLSPTERQARAAAYTQQAREFLQQAATKSEGKTQAQNELAWFLATCADARFRDLPQAVALAKKVTDKSPDEAGFWNTLGVAHYRAGDWKAAIADLNKSIELSKTGDGSDWFFLAMAHWQLGDKQRARKHFDQAVEWCNKNKPTDEGFSRHCRLCSRPQYAQPYQQGR